MKLLIMQSSPVSLPFLLLRSKYSPQHPVFKPHRIIYALRIYVWGNASCLCSGSLGSNLDQRTLLGH